jgi:hypothetical protein
MTLCLCHIVRSIPHYATLDLLYFSVVCGPLWLRDDSRFYLLEPRKKIYVLRVYLL